MSKPAAIAVSTRRICFGALGIIIVSLLAPAPASAAKATADPALRSSEQLDLRRLGKVSDDERAVLRVEWRAALSGADEARSVDEMLASLRRMQETIGEISRLIRGMPDQRASAETVAAEPAESGPSDKTLALAGAAAVGLLGIWWSRRRESKAQASAPAVATAPVEPESDVPPVIAPVALPPEVEAVAVAEKTVAPRSAQPAPPTPPAVARPAPQPETELPPTAPAETAAPLIEFSLEEADPDSIARANARLEKLQSKRSARAADAPRASNVEPTLELADIMLSLGLDQGAAETLVEYAEANPRQALHHWLKLLDIYRNSGNMEEFRETAEKLRHNFNIQAEDWAKENPLEAPTLESFPRLAEHVGQIWSKPAECIAYLQNLLEDNREGERAGFPRPVAEEILLLIDILKATSGANQAAAT